MSGFVLGGASRRILLGFVRSSFECREKRCVRFSSVPGIGISIYLGYFSLSYGIFFNDWTGMSSFSRLGRVPTIEIRHS